MTQRIEWMGTDYIATSVIPKGTEAGADQVDAEAAIMISADEAVAIEGSLDALEEFAQGILREVQDAKRFGFSVVPG